MKMHFNRRYTTIAVYAFLVLAAVVLFWTVLGRLDWIANSLGSILALLRPFVLGFGIAYLLNPALKLIERRMLGRAFPNMGDRPKRVISLLLAYLFAFGVVSVFIMIVLPQLMSSATVLIQNFYNYVNSADWVNWLNVAQSYLPEVDWTSTIFNYLEQYAQKIAETAYAMLSQAVPWMGGVVTRFASGLLDFVVGIIISIYVLADKERFCANCKRVWYAILPRKQADWLLQLASDTNHVFGGFISGKILDSLIIGVLCFLSLSGLQWVLGSFFHIPVLDMPNLTLVSVIVGVTNVIPYFGPFIGAIPSFFIILIVSPVEAFWFLILILILQQFDGNILGPKILGDSTGLSAFWVIFAIMLFGGLWGFIGMFLGVPIFSVIYMLAGRLVQSRLQKKGMPAQIESYCAPEAQLPQASPKKRAAQAQKLLEEIKRKKQRTAHTVRPLEQVQAQPPDMQEDFPTEEDQ